MNLQILKGIAASNRIMYTNRYGPIIFLGKAKSYICAIFYIQVLFRMEKELSSGLKLRIIFPDNSHVKIPLTYQAVLMGLDYTLMPLFMYNSLWEFACNVGFDSVNFYLSCMRSNSLVPQASEGNHNCHFCFCFLFVTK